VTKAIPSKPPVRPFQPAYAITTATRVPGQPRRPARPVAEPRPAEA
jgi:hypothetical protein